MTGKSGRTKTVTARLVAILAIFGFITATNTAFGAEADQVFHLNEEYENGWGYSIGVRAGDMLYIGGLTAIDDAGNPAGVGDARKQMEIIYEKMQEILAAHGATLKNIVRETVYTSDFEQLGAAIDVRSNAYKKAGAAHPSLVGIKVAGFSLDYIIVEITAVAYLGEPKK